MRLRSPFLIAFAASLLVVFAAALLAGCTVGPDFVRPDKPKEAGYTPEALAPQTASAAGDGGAAQTFLQGKDIPGQWWVVFQSAQLNGLIARSLKANPDIASAIAALKVSQQTARAQRAALFPTVGVGGTAAQTQAPSVLSAPRPKRGSCPRVSIETST